MVVDWLVVALVLLGHAALVVLVVNYVHGTGVNSHWIEVATMVSLALLGVLTLGAVVWVGGRPLASWPLVLRGYGLVCLAVATVGIPAATVARWLRGQARGATRRVAALDLSASVGSEALIGSGRLAWLLRLPGNESLRPERIEWDVPVAGLPPGLDGLTITHLTDLHFTHCFDRRYFEALADEAAREESDLVVFTGDLLDDATCLDWTLPVFSRLRGRRGQFAVLGNHDRHYGADRVAAEIERAGFGVLEGRWASLDFDGATLAIGGTSAPWGPPIDPSEAPAADLSVLLSHSPDLFDRAASWNLVDLMFCGHNHGGQVCPPLFGPVLMPSRFSRRFEGGFYRKRRTLMYVSRGAGAKHPIRYGCPPEITRFTFRVASEAGAGVSVNQRRRLAAGKRRAGSPIT